MIVLHVAATYVTVVGAIAVMVPGPRSRSRLRCYWDRRDWWMGAHVKPRAVYVCPLPCLVFRWSRR